jgi:hypothetical protein
MINGVAAGPYNQGEIVSRFHQGLISRDTLVRKNDEKHWISISDTFPEIEETPPPLPVSNVQHEATRQDTEALNWNDTSPHPWRRYFARLTDIVVNGFITIFGLFFIASLFGISLSPLDQALDNTVGAAIIVGFLSMPLNALLLSSLGTTIGKWLFGIRVLNADFKLLGFSIALKREGLVFVYGLGLGLPLISLLTLAMSYRKLKTDGMTSWDKSESSLVLHRYNTFFHYALSFLALMVVFVLIVIGNMK